MDTVRSENHPRNVVYPDAAGDITIALGPVHQGRSVMTDWIDTGLGKGRAQVTLAQIDTEGFEKGPIRSERLLTGNADIFDEADYVPACPKIRYAVAYETSSGRFRIAIRFKKAYGGGTIRFYWRASKEVSPEETEKDKNQDSSKDCRQDKGSADTQQPAKDSRTDYFYIENPPRYLPTGRKYTFRCHLPQKAADGQVVWTVTGGSIDRYGCFTAPDQPGVFEVKAALEGTDLTASVYVMVRG